jgi:hypothetical protein
MLPRSSQELMGIALESTPLDHDLAIQIISNTGVTRKHVVAPRQNILVSLHATCSTGRRGGGHVLEGSALHVHRREVGARIGVDFELATPQLGTRVGAARVVGVFFYSLLGEKAWNDELLKI